MRRNCTPSGGQLSRPSSSSTNRPPRVRHSHNEPSRSTGLRIQPIQQQTNLVTNAYCLRTNKDLNVHEYSLKVTTTDQCKDIPSSVLSRGYVARSIMKLVIDDLAPKLIGGHSLKGSIVIDSNLEAIFSPKTFEDPEFIFKNLAVKTDLLSRLNVDIQIRYARSFYLSDSSVQSSTLINAILHHQLLITMLRYGSVYYEAHDETRYRGTRLDLLSQQVMGIAISGLKRTINDETLIVINCPHSYITRSHRLIDLLAAFIAGQSVAPIQLVHSPIESRRVQRHPQIVTTSGKEPWFSDFRSILEGFKCRVTDSGNIINLRFSLTEEPASDLTIEHPTTKLQLTVAEYYWQSGINLNYPNLPCLISRSARIPYFPLELCTLLPGQKVPIFRLSTAARNHLATLNKPHADMFKRSSCKARDNLVAINEPQFSTFGISLSEAPVEAKGATLQKPTLQFRNKGFEPERDYWESGVFFKSENLKGDWCVVNTVQIDFNQEAQFFQEFTRYCHRFGFIAGKPQYIDRPKEELETPHSMEILIEKCIEATAGNLRFIMFVIDSSSTPLNRLIHLSFDDHPNITATCLRVESILNQRQQKSIFRTLVHKLNARLGGTNVTYHNQTLERLSLNCEDLMIIGLDVTHPDNELSGVSIVGCAYTYSRDLFKHKSLVWPQRARVELISKMDALMRRLLHEYYVENKFLPKQLIVYRDGVSHEEFEKVRNLEASKAQSVLIETAKEYNLAQPNLSYIIAQKRHTMRFFHENSNNVIANPPSGTLIDQDVVCHSGREFYLYSNTSPQATARPLHYHVLLNGLGIENLQKLTYFLCFNFGKCSGTLSMPSSLKYAHNAAYDARNRVIAAREFSENRFYTSKFFC